MTKNEALKTTAKAMLAIFILALVCLDESTWNPFLIFLITGGYLLAYGQVNRWWGLLGKGED